MAFKTFNAGDVLTASDVNDYLMEQAVIACTSGTRPASPNDGMLIYETDTDKLLLREGSVWRRIAKDSETGGPWTHFQAANDTHGSLAYQAGTDNAVSFVAPPSGKVWVSVSASLGTNSITSLNGAWLSFEIRTGSVIGSGTVTLAADDTRSVTFQPNAPATGFKYAPAHVRILVTALTAGSTYHARSMFRSDSGATAAVLNRTLVVEPVL